MLHCGINLAEKKESSIDNHINQIYEIIIAIDMIGQWFIMDVKYS